MRSLIISLLLCATGILPAAAQSDSIRVVRDTVYIFREASDTINPQWSKRYLKSLKRHYKFHKRLFPNQTSLQFAGSIGFLSAGFGWHYGKQDNWETEFFFGFIPEFSSDEEKFTFTLKQRFTPWRINLSRHWDIDPLMCSAYLCAIIGEDFWTREPSRYENGYYGFSNRFRLHFALGQRVRYKIPSKKRRRHKSVALYYELGTNELYLISTIPNRHLHFREALSLSIGSTFEIW